MAQRRVAVVSSHPLFGEGIAQLLEADETFQVHCLESDPTEACEQLKRFRPHVIVAEADGDDRPLRELVRALPAALVIMVCLENNVMDVYYGRHIVDASPENLVQEIHQGLRRRQVAARASGPGGRSKSAQSGGVSLAS